MEALGLESRAKPLLPKTEKAPKPVRRAPRGGKKTREAEDPQEQEPAAKAKAKAKAGVKKATKKKGNEQRSMRMKWLFFYYKSW